MSRDISRSIFFFNDPATTQIYTLSLHDALPISPLKRRQLFRLSLTGLSPEGLGPASARVIPACTKDRDLHFHDESASRSEEHTSELQSQFHLVCRLLLEKKKK